uniref:Retrovirus-related Pol polyprotein from transposon TNT 1-94 n=1 Tax=Cajanus cajan TaxID=3821 RepID=A0A151R7S5_CAJCA|nr:Retrovirus-related Pol polyprotein from transposon TNT 1-94 [Cajanus cajan]
MSEKGMKILVSKGKIPKLKEVEVGFCEPCMFGKQKRVTFAKSGRMPKVEKLELVHTDVYGPTLVSSLGRSRSKNDVILEGYSDAYLGGCSNTRKTTTRFVFTIGSTTVSWMSRLQKSVALSTIEAEYMTISEAGKELIWLKNFLEELGKK